MLFVRAIGVSLRGDVYTGVAVQVALFIVRASIFCGHRDWGPVMFSKAGAAVLAGGKVTI